jgi:hypothetical protein
MLWRKRNHKIRGKSCRFLGRPGLSFFALILPIGWPWVGSRVDCVDFSSPPACFSSRLAIFLQAYTFTEFPVIVHVDLDVLILKPLDDLFDAMIGKNDNVPPLSKIARMWPDGPVPDQINAFFTRDCKLAKDAMTPCI